MKNIAIIEASITFESVLQSLKISIDDIKKNNAHRTDLIESMQKHYDYLQDARKTFNIVCDENRQYQAIIFDLQRQIMDLSYKLKQASKVNDNLIQGI